MTDEEYKMNMGEIAVVSAEQLGWTKDLSLNAVQYLVQAAYQEGWDNAEKHSFDVGV